MVAALRPGDLAAGAAEDDGVPDGRRGLERGVRVSLQRHPRAAAPALVLGDQHLALHVVQAVGERLGRETAEDDGVRRAETRAGEHRDGDLRDHAHVDPDGRPLPHPELLQAVGELDDLALEAGEGNGPAIVGGLALPVVGDLAAEPGLDVAVDAVEADVERAAEVPPGVGRLPLEQRRERVEPRHSLTARGLPELLEVPVVDVGLRVRLRGEPRGRRVAPLLPQQVGDRPLFHAYGSRS